MPDHGRGLERGEHGHVRPKRTTAKTFAVPIAAAAVINGHQTAHVDRQVRA